MEEGSTSLQPQMATQPEIKSISIRNLPIENLVIKGASGNPDLDLLHCLDLFVLRVVDYNSGDESFRFLAITEDAAKCIRQTLDFLRRKRRARHDDVEFKGHENKSPRPWSLGEKLVFSLHAPVRHISLPRCPLQTTIKALIRNQSNDNMAYKHVAMELTIEYHWKIAKAFPFPRQLSPVNPSIDIERSETAILGSIPTHAHLFRTRVGVNNIFLLVSRTTRALRLQALHRLD